MIARFRVLLPFVLSIRQGEGLKPYEYPLNGYQIRIYPPRRSGVDPSDLVPFSPTPLRTILNSTGQDAKQEPIGTIVMNGAPTIQADMLQIDFLKPEFDRRKAIVDHSSVAGSLSTGDPPISLAFEVINRFLAITRTVTQGATIRLLMPGQLPWRLEYLTDDEKPIAIADEVLHLRFGQTASWRVVGVNTEVWETVKSLLEGYAPATWETLLLDAEAALPSVGTSIVLAFAALETLIETALNFLADHTHVPRPLWEWINERDKDHRLTPAVGEQFDSLLRSLTGRSLKDEGKLWEAFQHLRRARNSFLHTGTAMIGIDEVTPARAQKLVAETKNVADWIESFLPPEVRRPKIKTEVAWHFHKALEPPAPEQ